MKNVLLLLGVMFALCACKQNPEKTNIKVDSTAATVDSTNIQGLIEDKKNIPFVSDIDSLLRALNLRYLDPCTASNSKKLCFAQAMIWSPEAVLIDVFSVAFVVENKKALSLSWCFIFKDQATSSLLYVIASNNRIQKTGIQRKSKKSKILERKLVDNWDISPSEYNWHLRSINLDNKWQTFWVQKQWGQLEGENSPRCWVDLFDCKTGKVVKELARTPQIMDDVFGFNPKEGYTFEITYRYHMADGITGVESYSSQNRLVNIRGKDELAQTLSGGGIEFKDPQGNILSKGVMITFSKKKNNREGYYFDSAYYENGKRGVVEDYLRWIIELD